jgi:hypothetical protein
VTKIRAHGRSLSPKSSLVRPTAAYQAYYKAYFQYQAQTQAAKVAEKSKTPSNIEAAQWYRQYSG